MKSVDIWGCCVSRDIIGIGGADEGYDVRTFIQECSFPVQFTKHQLPQISPSNFDGIINKSPCWKRWASYDLNKNVPQILDESGSEWLIIDSRVVTYPIKKIILSNGSIEYVTEPMLSEKLEVLEKYGIEYKIERAFFSDKDIQAGVKEWIKYIKKRYHNKIILIQCIESTNIMNSCGSIEYKWDKSYQQSKSSEFDKIICNNLRCYVINNPLNIIADSVHQWGESSVHYLDEYYDYAYRCVNLITNSNENITLHRKLELLYIETISKIMEIRSGETLSLNNAYKQIIDGKDDSSKVKDLITRIGANDDRSRYYLFRLISENVVIDTSLFEGIDVLRLNKNTNEIDVATQLLIQSSQKTKNICYSYLAAQKEPNIKLLKKIGIMLLYGNNVEKNLEISKVMLQKCFDSGDTAVKDELLKALWLTDTTDSLKQMQIIMDKLANDDCIALSWLSRMYRDGKGYDKDIDKAEKIMKTVKDRGNLKINNEYFDLLWARNNPKKYSEMIDCVKTMSEKNDPHGCARLARMYRDGKGVPKDLSKAAHLMKIGCVNGPWWAKHEYVDILWTINTMDNDKTMFEFALSLSESNNAAIF